MIGRLADWFNSRRWFIRYLIYAEWCPIGHSRVAADLPFALRLGPYAVTQEPSLIRSLEDAACVTSFP